MVHENAQPFEVLLVEDEEADAHLVQVAMQENKMYCCLHHVLDGVEALEFLRRSNKRFQDVSRPDLILLDLNMPRMNGHEFLREIKADPELATIPVVILTTSDVEKDVVASYQSGAAGYITKPVDLDQFIHAVRQIEDYWFVLARLPRKEE